MEQKIKKFLCKVARKYNIKYKELEKLSKIYINLNMIEPKKYSEVNIEDITVIHSNYPDNFINFCKTHDLNAPKINSGRGKALAAMLYNPFKYWTRISCDKFVKKFGIDTKDSIQLFNKHSQWGIKTNSGTEKGKLYIVYPYCLSNKYNIRKDFKYDGSIEQKNIEIDKIKSTIITDYIDIPNEKWQLGHKNPGISNISNNNLVLQPPIQSKYRDEYIFFDTLTKMPLPSKLEKMINSKEITFTEEQINNYLELFTKLKI
jgi:hypothetical protein